MFAVTQEILRSNAYWKRWLRPESPRDEDAPVSRDPANRIIPVNDPAEDKVDKGREASVATSWDEASEPKPEASRQRVHRKYIRGELRDRRDEFMEKKEIRIVVATWNVNGRRPDDDLELDEWLDIEDPADVVVVGFQEIVPLNASNVLIGDEGDAAVQWEQLIRDTLGRAGASIQPSPFGYGVSGARNRESEAGPEDGGTQAIDITRVVAGGDAAGAVAVGGYRIAASASAAGGGGSDAGTINSSADSACGIGEHAMADGAVPVEDALGIRDGNGTSSREAGRTVEEVASTGTRGQDANLGSGCCGELVRTSNTGEGGIGGRKGREGQALQGGGAGREAGTGSAGHPQQQCESGSAAVGPGEEAGARRKSHKGLGSSGDLGLGTSREDSSREVGLDKAQASPVGLCQGVHSVSREGKMEVLQKQFKAQASASVNDSDASGVMEEDVASAMETRWNLGASTMPRRQNKDGLPWQVRHRFTDDGGGGAGGGWMDRNGRLLSVGSMMMTPRRARRYVRVASKQMVGVHVSVWMRAYLCKRVRDVQVASVGCGLMGILANKGAVAISLVLYETSLCLVCSHLTSGDAQGDESRRSTDVEEILRRMSFPRDERGREESLPGTIAAHDMVIWLGDLNYRLNLRDEEARALIAQQDWEALQAGDQLRQERAAGNVFRGWHEGCLLFPPTYKYRLGSDKYVGDAPAPDGEKLRTPAWCDRVLWYGSGLELLNYGRTEYRMADHRPVTAVLLAKLDTLVPHKLEAILAEVRARADAAEMRSRPETFVHPQLLHLGELRYGLPVDGPQLELCVTGPVPARFSFVNVSGSGPPCPPWIQVQPQEGLVAPGSSQQIRIRACLDAESLSLDDVIERHGLVETILVLRIQGGGDHFVDITGQYVPSCWGLSLGRLAQLPGPVRQIWEVRPEEQDDLDEESGTVSGSGGQGEGVAVQAPRELHQMAEFLAAGDRPCSVMLFKGLGGMVQQQQGEDDEDVAARVAVGVAGLAAVRECLDTGMDLPPRTSPATVAAALLSFLSSLPGGGLLGPVLVTADADLPVTKWEVAALVDQSLPPLHAAVLTSILELCTKLLQRTELNKLCPQDLAVAFGDVLFKSASELDERQRKRRVQFVKQLIETKCRC